MIDQSLVTSGFDTEVLLGGRYLSYLLLSSVETGTIPTTIEIDDDPSDTHLLITLRPPTDYDRRYEPHPGAPPAGEAVDDAFHVGVIVGDGADLAVRMRVDVEDVTGGPSVSNQFIDLFVDLDLVTETDDDGAMTDARLSFSVVDLELDVLLQLAIAVAGMTEAELLALVKAELDREIDFGLVGAGQAVQSMAMQKLAGPEPAIGVYLNLRLRNDHGEDDFVPDRGRLDQAQNFLPVGDDLAFGLSGSVYALLGRDAEIRMSEEIGTTGRFHIPIREDQSDPESERKGRIDSIDVDADGNTIRIRVTGEFFVDILPDPDFTLTIRLTPVIVAGELTFEMSHDVDLDLLGDLFALVLIAFILNAFAGLLVTLLIVGLQELLIEPLANDAVGEQAEGAFDASFLDALPTRITAERRRWDPFYVTEHQVLTLIDGIQITNAGIGFSGVAALDRQPDPVGHVVVRTESRDADGRVSGLDYRVRDHADAADDLVAVFPGTDREPSTMVFGDDETDLFRITRTEARARIAADKLRSRIFYTAKKVDLREHQIHRLLCVSNTEIGERRRRLVRDFVVAAKADVLADQGDTLTDEIGTALEAELGRPPTEDELDDAIDARLDELIADSLDAFEEDELPGLLDAAVDAILRFDVDAPELLDLEADGVLFLDGGYQRIDGAGGRYYRDRPDGNEADNLHRLPRYTSADR